MMSVASDSTAHFQTSEDDQLADYRAVSGLAIVGLMLGVASSLVMWRLLLLFLPAAAIFTCFLALARVRASDGRLTGRRAAIIGLCLAFFFAAAAPTQMATRHALVVHQARPLAELFFALLASDEPQKAVQLMEYPSERPPFDDHLWDHYRNDPIERENLTKFVEYPLVRTLLALGDSCDVRFYQSGGVERITSSIESVMLIYAVTFGQDNQKKSFFVSLRLERSVRAQDESPRWRISTFDVLRKRYPGV